MVSGAVCASFFSAHYAYGEYLHAEHFYLPPLCVCVCVFVLIVLMFVNIAVIQHNYLKVLYKVLVA